MSSTSSQRVDEPSCVGVTVDIYRDRLYQNAGFPALIDLLDVRYRRILDVGCGDGANLRLLAARQHDAVGLTVSEAEAKVVRNLGFTCVVWDITQSDLPFSPRTFDALIFSHVLEHTQDPEVVLKTYSQLVRPGGSVYVALPNVLQFRNRWDLLLGRFRYTETGIMDRTHLRFFDFRTARELVESAGLSTNHHFGVGQVPLGPIRRIAPGFANSLDQVVSRHWPGLFAFHVLVSGTVPNR